MPEIDAKFLHSLLFYAFGSVSILFALGVLFLPKIVHAAISMIFAFVAVACVFVLLNSDFIGLAQIMIYATAVSILFLFTVMLVKDDGAFEFKQIFSLRKFAAACGVFLLFISAIFSFTNGFGMFDKLVKVFAMQTDLVELGIKFKDAVCIKLLGINLLSNYIFAFEFISILILVVILGVAMFALRGNNCRLSAVEKGERSDDI